MSDHKSITEIEIVNAPWNKELTFSDVEYEGGFKMLRMRVKEGKRFTDLELDSDTAQHLIELMGAWVKANPPAA
ncbi:DUF6967 family protein [Magnetovibrio blakemorei]|uniref:Uncharacterized protein n=1 Tax=Magnetovibrio blakemorei TaxID=28181 RepID=A0A1E5Q9M0_9PROT|nr:hypothetical protein [Magnetovibrio blakemorei]OEJ68378.1 hypothetical protein BEN30_06360 [Magnetovibrio blakemorei]